MGHRRGSLPPACLSQDENLQPKPQPGCLFKAQNPKGTLNKQSSSHILPTEHDPSCRRLQKGFQHPGGVRGFPAATRTALSHRSDGSKDDAVGPGGIAGRPYRPEHPHTSGSPQVGNVMTQFLGDLPMTPAPSHQPHCTPTGIGPHQLEGFNSSSPRLVKREETIRRVSPSIPSTPVSPRTCKTHGRHRQEGAGERQHGRQLPPFCQRRAAAL